MGPTPAGALRSLFTGGRLILNLISLKNVMIYKKKSIHVGGSAATSGSRRCTWSALASGLPWLAAVYLLCFAAGGTGPLWCSCNTLADPIPKSPSVANHFWDLYVCDYLGWSNGGSGIPYLESGISLSLSLGSRLKDSLQSSGFHGLIFSE